MCYISLIVVDTSKINVDWVVTYSNSFWSFARDAFKIANDKRHQIRAHLHALLKVIRAKFDRVIALKQTAKSNLNITPQLHIKDVTQTKGGKFDSRTKCSTLPDGAYPLGGGRREAGGYFYRPKQIKTHTGKVSGIFPLDVNSGVTADLDPPADLDPRFISAGGFGPPRSKSASGYGPPFADLDPPPTKLSF